MNPSNIPPIIRESSFNSAEAMAPEYQFARDNLYEETCLKSNCAKCLYIYIERERSFIVPGESLLENEKEV